MANYAIIIIMNVTKGTAHYLVLMTSSLDTFINLLINGLLIINGFLITKKLYINKTLNINYIYLKLNFYTKRLKEPPVFEPGPFGS